MRNSTTTTEPKSHFLGNDSSRLKMLFYVPLCKVQAGGDQSETFGSFLNWPVLAINKPAIPCIN